MEESQARELGLCDDCAEKVSNLSKEKLWVTVLKLPFVLIGKLVNLIGFIAFFLIAFFATSFIVVIVSYSFTQYQVKEIIGADKQIFYVHEDRETAEILNYITGRCPKPARWSGEAMPDRCPYNEDVYKMVWAIEQVSGGPKVRFMDMNDSPDGGKVSAHYTASLNIMYIHRPKGYGAKATISEFVAEASHALQYHDNPARFMFMSYRDISLVIARTLADTAQFFDESYAKRKNEMYHLNGTVENEAHDVIEPQLQKRFSPR